MTAEVAIDMNELLPASNIPKDDNNINSKGQPRPPASAAATNATLSISANLTKLLPTGTVLAFQTIPTFASYEGKCYTASLLATSLLLFLCALSCLLFSFTDSFIGPDGKLYYGLATLKGFYVFNCDGDERARKGEFGDLRRFRIRRVDWVHGVFSLFAFLAIAFSSADVQNCFFPDAANDTKAVVRNFLPIVTVFLAGLVFFVFPTCRRSIGYSDTTPLRSQEDIKT